jgi:broad specificity phosphatase PhoE
MCEMELIIVRHGETEWNREHVFRGRRDIRLNSNGIAQADATAKALEGRVFEAIYTSPLKRSVVTARRIAKPHEIAVRESVDLSDISYGAWEGLTVETVKREYPPMYERWLKNPAKVRFTSGESMRRAWKRVNSALREIIWTHGTGTIVIVSHRMPIKMMTAYLLHQKRDAIGGIRHDPCAISIFKVRQRQSTPVILNDSSHLRGLNIPPMDDF